MLQVDWQEEANKARQLWLNAHKSRPADAVLQQALSGTDLEQPLASGLNSLPEQSGMVASQLPKGSLMQHKLS